MSKGESNKALKHVTWSDKYFSRGIQTLAGTLALNKTEIMKKNYPLLWRWFAINKQCKKKYLKKIRPLFDSPSYDCVQCVMCTVWIVAQCVSCVVHRRVLMMSQVSRWRRETMTRLKQWPADWRRMKTRLNRFWSITGRCWEWGAISYELLHQWYDEAELLWTPTFKKNDFLKLFLNIFYVFTPLVINDFLRMGLFHNWPLFNKMTRLS